jgi:hypothetical protein
VSPCINFAFIALYKNGKYCNLDVKTLAGKNFRDVVLNGGSEDDSTGALSADWFHKAVLKSIRDIVHLETEDEIISIWIELENFSKVLSYLKREYSKNAIVMCLPSVDIEQEIFKNNFEDLGIRTCESGISRRLLKLRNTDHKLEEKTILI